MKFLNIFRVHLYSKYHTHTCIHIYTEKNNQVYIHTYIHTYTHIYIYLLLYIIYVYLSAYVYVCACEYIRVCQFPDLLYPISFYLLCINNESIINCSSFSVFDLYTYIVLSWSYLLIYVDTNFGNEKDTLQVRCSSVLYICFSYTYKHRRTIYSAVTRCVNELR